MKEPNSPPRLTNKRPLDVKPHETTWEDIERDYRMARSDVAGLRRETREEAIDETYPTEIVEGTEMPEPVNPKFVKYANVRIRHHRVLPYVANLNQTLIDAALEVVNGELQEIEIGFRKQQASPAFIKEISRFYLAKGFIEAAYSATEGAVGKFRAGKRGREATSLEDHRTYAARWIWENGGQELWKNGDLNPQAMMKLRVNFLSHINKMVRQDGDGVRPAKWFEKFYTEVQDPVSEKVKRSSSGLADRYGRKLTLPKIQKLLGG